MANKNTRIEYDAALRAALWQRDLAPRGLEILEREITADRDRRFRYVALASLVAVAVLALVTCSCARPAPAAPAPAEHVRTIAEQHQAAVALRITCEIGGATLYSGPAGSGVVVSDYEVLTAYHVIDGAEWPEGVRCTFDAIDWTGDLHPLRTVQQSELDDVARLRSFVPFTSAPVTIAPAPAPGDRVCVVAWVPSASRRCGDVQVFSSPVAPGRSGDLWWDGIVESGNSGAGVYDDRGRLVAITTHRTSCPTNGQHCGGRGTRLAPLLAWVLGSP